MKAPTFSQRVLIILVALLIVLATALLEHKYAPSNPSTGGVACTMEAKQCPDGSYVGRHGPDCAFDPCPQAGTSSI